MQSTQGQSNALGLTFRLAWRNIWRQKRRTWLTAVAMIFSNILLVFMISLQLGSYEMMINNTLRMLTGQVQVQRQGYLDDQKMRQTIAGIEGLAETIREAVPGAGVAARAMAFVLASSEDRTFGIQVIGVQPDHEGAVSSIPGLVRHGRYLDDPDAAEIVIGSVMARNLKLDIGDELTFLGSGRDGSFAAGVVTVVGIFNSGSQDLDRGVAELPMGYFQDAFAMQGSGHVIALTVDKLGAVAGTIAALQPVIADRQNLVALDWMRLVPGLKQAIQADFTSAWFMYAVLIVLVAFSVLNTQLMSVMERTREFGMIMALGVRPRRLVLLVLLETLLMAALGFIIGVFLGSLVTAYFASAGFAYPGMEEMSAKFNLPSVIHPALEPIGLLLGPTVVLVFCLLAALYPAMKLYGLKPVEAMRQA
jgi:ABC-type lipoprotein release transport system permease subunit